MGLFSAPKFPSRPRGEEALFDLGRQMQGDATANLSGVRARLSDIMDTSDERSRAMGRTNADAWQAQAQPAYDSTRPRVSPFARAMQAGRARVRGTLAAGGLEDLKSVQGRAAIARMGDGLRSGQVRDLTSMSAAYDEYGAARSQAQSVKQGGLLGLAGTVAGYGIGYGMDRFGKPSAADDQLMNTMSQTGYDRNI